MADQVDAIIRLRRGPDGERRTITFQSGEVGYSTDVKRAFIGDGTTVGGSLLGNQNTIDTTNPSPSAIKYDLFFNSTECITYMLSSEAGPDNIANYARITPIADEVSLIYRNGKFSINPLYFNNPATGYVHLSGDQMTGYLSLVGAPVLDLHATPKFWVSNALTALSSSIVNYVNNPAGGGNGGFVHLSGDRMTSGYLSLANEPTLSAHAVNLGYLSNKYIEDPTIKADNQLLKYSYSQQAWVAGNITNDFIDTTIRTVAVNTTLASTDSNNIVMFNKTGASVICYLPTDLVGHRIGTQIIVIQKGSAQVVFTAAAGATIHSSGDRFKTIEQWSGAVVIKIAANEWFVGGDVTV
jgi:hypothetical protein